MQQRTDVPRERHHDTTPVHTLFGLDVVDEMDAGRMSRVAAGVLGAVRVRNFFSPHECRTTVASLVQDAMGEYDQRLVGRRIAKLGPAVFDYYNSARVEPSYWEEAAAAARVRSRLLDGRDPLGLAGDRLAAAWQQEVTPATVGGAPLFAGMIREMYQGAGLHFDEVEREFPAGLDETPLSQLAFNCYLETPPDGGALTVFRRRWRPDDEHHRDGYWYRPEVVAGEPSLTVAPATGDAIVFDPRNYHMIEANRGGRRVTLSFFIGFSRHGNLLLWS
ncbi:2OG-Fe(II)-dependent halogenase WelO5 family protein [Streptomyces sp. NPDC001985]|uniref:2OG-Fe(II)-dependent halogenase WelO5 family protein n=1 Tax=Streptomyces sp. NPDC001985 TaxID=3154406 RepID=UPI003333923D